MKYIKLLMLLAIVGIFAGCSDDESFNTSSATIGFTSDRLVLKENSGMVNIPIEIKGRINGDIKLVITELQVREAILRRRIKTILLRKRTLHCLQ